MLQYDVKCPMCGTVNKDLYLEETDGWMICEECGVKTQNALFQRERSTRIPVLSMKEITVLIRRGVL